MTKKYTYSDITAYANKSSVLAHLVKKIAIYVIFTFQQVPIHANVITLTSLIPVIAAVYVLIFFKSHILFAFLLFLSYLIDCIDGIWSRLKNQQSAFGTFFDPLLDEVKDLLIDIGFIVFFYDTMHIYIADSRILLGILLLYLMVKSLYYIVRDHYLLMIPKISQPKKKLAIIGYGGAEKNLIVFPLVSLSLGLFTLYFIIYSGLYVVNLLSLLLRTKVYMEHNE